MACSETMSLTRVNTRLLPVKASYFFSLAAVASMLPYLGIYMKQVGFSPTEAGITYGLMPFIGAIVRPLIGALADKFRGHKIALMLCCIFSGVFFGCLLFVPPRDHQSATESNISHPVDLVCDGTSSRFIRYCPSVPDGCRGNSSWWTEVDEASVLNNSTGVCHVRCNRTSVLGVVGCSDEQLGSASNHSNCSINTSSDFSIQGFSRAEVALPCIAFHFEELVIDNATISNLECPQSHTEACTMQCQRAPEVLDSTCEADSTTEPTMAFDRTFWYIFMFMLAGNIALSPIFSLTDAMTYDFLGEDRGKWGQQRAWGTVGFAIFAVVSGLSMDMFSSTNDSGHTDYTPAFVLYAVLSFLAAVAVWLYTISPVLVCAEIMRNVGKILRQLRAISLLVLVFIFGMYTGLIETFLYWHLSTMGASQLLFGLCMLMNCLPEVPILMLSGAVIKKLGHINMLYISTLAYAVRMTSYSFLTNPWIVLVVEPLHGVTFGLMYAAASSYASIITPPGMHGVMQGLIGGVHFGLGKGVGSVLSGPIFQRYGAVITFRAYGISAFIICFLYLLLNILVLNRLVPMPKDGKEDAAPHTKEPPEKETMLNGTKESKPDAEDASAKETGAMMANAGEIPA